MDNMKKVGIFLLLLGMACILYPSIMHQKQEEEIEKLQAALNRIEETEIENGQEVELSPSLSIKSDVLTEALELRIPAIDLQAPVLSEPTKEYLNIALTQIKRNQVPGMGNFTIAGHNSSVKGRHFNRLDELVIGDEINLVDGEDIYTYQVESIEIVTPQNVDILYDQPNKNEITLVTCTSDGTKRLVVRGKRIS